MSAKAPLPPGPDLFTTLRDLQPMLNFPVPYWQKWRETYGNAFHLPLGPESVFFFFHADHVEHILGTHQKNFLRGGRGYDLLRLIQGNGLLTSDGPFWRAQRKRMQPAFHRKNVEKFTSTVVRLTSEMLDRWEEFARKAEPLDLYRDLIWLAILVVGEVLGSLNVSGSLEKMEPVRALVNEELVKRTCSIFSLPLWVPTPRNIRFKKAIQYFYDMSQGIVNERRRMRPEERPYDLITLLLESIENDSESGMTDLQLCDEIITIAGAANETSGLSLTWLFHQLGMHPEIQNRAFEEVDTVLQGRDPAVEDLPKLKYVLQIFQEILRLYPPIYGIPRQSVEEDVIGGYRVPARSIVIVSPFITQRLEEFWERPKEFDPERFSQGEKAASRRYAYFPFGEGPHMCIGKLMAEKNSQIIISMILKRFQVELVDKSPLVFEPGITLRPARKVMVRLRQRSG